MQDANRCFVSAMQCLVMNYGEFGSIRFYFYVVNSKVYQVLKSSVTRHYYTRSYVEETSTNTLDLTQLQGARPDPANVNVLETARCKGAEDGPREPKPIPLERDCCGEFPKQ